MHRLICSERLVFPSDKRMMGIILAQTVETFLCVSFHTFLFAQSFVNFKSNLDGEISKIVLKVAQFC